MGVLLAEEPVFSASLGCVSDVKRSEVSRFSNLLRTLNLHPWVFRASFLRGVLRVDFWEVQCRMSGPCKLMWVYP